MPTSRQTQASIALQALREAATACQAIQAQLVPTQAVTKEDRSPVTAADFASQAIVCAHLSKAFPHDPVIGEEAATVLRDENNQPLLTLIVNHVSKAMNCPVTASDVMNWIDRGSHRGNTGRYWTLDPIDGTKGFLRRGQYAIALALIEDGQVVLGALGCPELATTNQPKGTLLLAVRGQGVTRHNITLGDTTPGMPTTASPTTDLAKARMCESVEAGHSDQDASALIVRDLGLSAPAVRMDSQAKYATLACGDADIYLRLPRNATYREMIWDHAAGVLAVQEAGGTVTDIQGRPLDFSQGRRLENNLGVVATTGNLHTRVLHAVQAHVKL